VRNGDDESDVLGFDLEDNVVREIAEMDVAKSILQKIAGVRRGQQSLESLIEICNKFRCCFSD